MIAAEEKREISTVHIALMLNWTAFGQTDGISATTTPFLYSTLDQRKDDMNSRHLRANMGLGSVGLNKR